MIAFVEEWQTLIGAALGTLGAFLIAVLAYWLSRFSQRKDAAHQVYFELQMYQTAVHAFLNQVQHVQDDIDQGEAADADIHQYVESVERLRSARPVVSPRVESAMGILYSTDFVLAVNLEAFRAAAGAAERMFKLLEEEEARILNSGKAGRDKNALLKVMRSAGGLANAASAKAKEANQIIGATYINRWAAFKRFIRWCRKRALPQQYQAELRARNRTAASAVDISNQSPAD